MSAKLSYCGNRLGYSSPLTHLLILLCMLVFKLLIQIRLQYRNMTTVLTREYLDVRPDGWLDYAAKRIAQLYASDLLHLSFL
jgi:pyruvate formate-lyase activating enzyme-like uncharacterized protein